MVGRSKVVMLCFFFCTPIYHVSYRACEIQSSTPLSNDTCRNEVKMCTGCGRAFFQPRAIQRVKSRIIYEARSGASTAKRATAACVDTIGRGRRAASHTLTLTSLAVSATR